MAVPGSSFAKIEISTDAVLLIVACKEQSAVMHGFGNVDITDLIHDRLQDIRERTFNLR